MVSPPPPIPDGSHAFTAFAKWARDSLLALRIQEAPGARIHRTTRGTAVIPEEQPIRNTIVQAATSMDHAIFVDDYDGLGSKAIFGVGTGQVFVCDPDTGELIKKINFGQASFSPQWIVWSPATKKLYVTSGIQFDGWDQNTEGTYFSGIGLYGIDPVTSAVRGPFNPFDFGSYSIDTADTIADTAFGPMTYYSGDELIYGIVGTVSGTRFYLYAFDPSTHEFVNNTFTDSVDLSESNNPVELFFPSSPPEWFDLYLDGAHLWVSNNYKGSESNPSTIHHFNLEDRTHEWYGYFFVGSETEVAMDFEWSPPMAIGLFYPSIGIGSESEPLKPGTDVQIDYIGGGVRYFDGETQISGWNLNNDSTAPSRRWLFTSNNSGDHFLTETPEDYDTVAELEEANEGLALTVAASGSDDYGHFYNLIDNTFFFTLENSSPPFTWRIRYTKMVGEETDSFFGMVKTHGKFYLASSVSSLIGILDLDGIDPEGGENGNYTKATYAVDGVSTHKLVYVSATDRIYVPTGRGNAVVIFNPNTNTVQEVKTGFDVPFHIVATDTKVWAVQRSAPGLKLVADI